MYQKCINKETNLAKMIDYQDRSAPHLAIIKCNSKSIRDKLQSYLFEAGIQTAIHYKNPCHSQPFLDSSCNLLINECEQYSAQNIADTILSLPLSEVHTDDEIEYVSSMVNKFITRFN